MILGDIVKIIKLPNIYSLPIIVTILFNYLAIQYGIKYPIEKRKDITKKELFIPILIFSSIILTFLLKTNDHSNSMIIIALLANYIELYLMKPKHEQIEEIITKNIKDYFESKK